MKTNKEKALKHINQFTVTGGNVPTVHPYIAKEAVELASKPDWYYPEKGEFPEINNWICVVDETGEVEPHKYRVMNKEFIDDNFNGGYYIAWTYLPKYEDNE